MSFRCIREVLMERWIWKAFDKWCIVQFTCLVSVNKKIVSSYRAHHIIDTYISPSPVHFFLSSDCTVSDRTFPFLRDENAQADDGGRGSVNRKAGSWTFEKSWAEILGIIKKGRVDDVSELRRVKNSYSWLITESDPNRVVFFYCIFNQKPIRYLLQWLLAFVLRHLLGCATDVYRTELHLASGLGLGLARWWSLILSV